MNPVPFDNSYARLPDRFFSRQAPEPVSRPEPIRFNLPLAAQLGIDEHWLQSDAGVRALAGNELPPGAEPIATVYAGHQFGGWNPQLGDGRAVLLGEVVDRDGRRFDIQLKGSGKTPYSRMGDGRAPLGPVLREYVVSEAMAALGVPTTRSLAAVLTGDPVYREGAQPGAVLTRVAGSHIRVGTFQFFASRGDTEGLRLLVDHVIQRHYPQAAEADNAALALLHSVVQAQAELVARWQLLGFIHGVMNTDNMLLSGETVDYGPCAFMDQFNPDQVYSSIDHGGRYAYRNQPGIAHWNLACLAQTLLPLISDEEETAVAQAQAAVDGFADRFLAAHQAGMSKKLGIELQGEEDETLVQDLLSVMAETAADFTLVFRRLSDLAGDDAGDQDISEVFELDPRFEPWLARWQARFTGDSRPAKERQAAMYQANPVFIPRNHLVEAVIRAAVDEGDFQPFHDLVDLLASPHNFDAAQSHYALPPRPEQVVRQTFCGT